MWRVFAHAVEYGWVLDYTDAATGGVLVAPLVAAAKAAGRIVRVDCDYRDELFVEVLPLDRYGGTVISKGARYYEHTLGEACARALIAIHEGEKT